MHCTSVAVGTALASGPPHRSVQAGLLHTALTSDEGGKPLFRPGMENAGRGEPGIGDEGHAIPGEPGFLTSTAEGSVPQPRALGPKSPQCLPVTRKGVVREVTSNDRLKPDPLLGDGLMHAPPKFRFDLLKLGGQPPLHSGATDQKLPSPVHLHKRE